jgi:hypothetical protein
MSSLMMTAGPDLVIPINTAVSNSINWLGDMFDAEALGIQAPAVMDAHNFIIQVSQDGATWGDLQDLTATPVKAPSSANIGMMYNGIIAAFPYMRIKDNSGNVAAERTFKTHKMWRGC